MMEYFSVICAEHSWNDARIVEHSWNYARTITWYENNHWDMYTIIIHAELESFSKMAVVEMLQI